MVVIYSSDYFCGFSLDFIIISASGEGDANNIAYNRSELISMPISNKITLYDLLKHRLQQRVILHELCAV